MYEIQHFCCMDLASRTKFKARATSRDACWSTPDLLPPQHTTRCSLPHHHKTKCCVCSNWLWCHWLWCLWCGAIANFHQWSPVLIWKCIHCWYIHTPGWWDGFLHINCIFQTSALTKWVRTHKKDQNILSNWLE